MALLAAIGSVRRPAPLTLPLALPLPLTLPLPLPLPLTPHPTPHQVWFLPGELKLLDTDLGALQYTPPDLPGNVSLRGVSVWRYPFAWDAPCPETPEDQPPGWCHTHGNGRYGLKQTLLPAPVRSGQCDTRPQLTDGVLCDPNPSPDPSPNPNPSSDPNPNPNPNPAPSPAPAPAPNPGPNPDQACCAICRTSSPSSSPRWWA